MKRKIPLTVLLPNIRSVYNVGSIFRTADAAGVSKMYLAGYTPSPIDRFGRKRSDIAKVALGAEDSASWEYHQDPKVLLEALKSRGVFIVAAEQDSRSVSYTKAVLPADREVCVMFGEETKGLPPELLTYADQILEIPMQGEKESLNVSVAAGIILFRLRDQ